MDPQQGLSIRELKAAARRRAGLAAAAGGAVALLAIFVAAVLPNEYEGTATLLVEPQVISQKLVEAGLEESDLNDRLHIMTMEIRSRGRLSRVIDELGLYAEESEEMTREQVIEFMNEQISVEPVLPELDVETRRVREEPKINTFRIHFRHESPKRAAEVANTLANDFIEQHIEERVQSSGETSEFIRSELQQLERQLQEVEDRIAEVKAENRGSLPEELDSNRRILERTLSELRAAQSELSLAQSDANFYRQQANLAGRYYQGQEEVSPTRRLQALELQLNQYRSRGYTERHPDIVAVKQEMASLEEAIESGEAEDEEVLSPTQQSNQAEAARAEARAEAAKKEIEELEAQVAEYEERIAKTPRVAEQLGVLESRQESLLASYQDYAQRRQAAGVAASMERRQKGEQFRLLESAYPPLEPASPNRPLIILLGVILGVGAGMGVAFLAEASDTSFHEARGLQGALGVPVLASIPGILLDADRRALRRRRVRKAFAAAAVTGVVLVASVAGNWMVNGVPGPVQKLVAGDAVETERTRTGG